MTTRRYCAVYGYGILVYFLFALTVVQTRANDWPCYRGPNSDGHTDEKITIWPPQELWRAHVGQGFSQVVVSQGKVYTMGWANNQNQVWCFKETSTGVDPTPVWKAAYSSAAGNNGGTSLMGTYPTPAVDGGQVYTFDNVGVLNCYSAASGALLWSSTAFSGGGPNSAGSPLVEGDLVIVDAGGNNGASAISKTTHNVVWGANGSGERYTSPFAATVGSQRTIIGYGANITGLDPATGNVLWYYPNPVPTHSGGVANPMIVDGNKLFVSEGYNNGCSLFDLTGASGQLANRAWHNNNLCTKENAAALYKGYAYGSSEPGSGSGLTCLNLANGNAMWQQSGFGPESATLSAGDQLIVMTGDNSVQAGNGSLVVAQATSTAYTELHRLTGILSDYTWTVPTLCNGNLYVRSRDGTLICYSVGAAPVQGCSTKITFSGYSKSETLTNFPALVCLSTNIAGFDYAQFSSQGGGDLRFTASDGTTPLNYELDTWNNTGVSYAWVQVPKLTAGTFIWAFWGNAGLTAPACTTNGATWDSTFVGVWHMNETVSTGGTQHDSTANHLDGTFTATSPSASGVAAVIGKGDHINGNGGLHIPDSAKLHVMEQTTWSVWSKSDNANSVGWYGYMMVFPNDLYLGPHPGNGNAEVMFANYDCSNGRHGTYYTATDIATWNYWGGVNDSVSGNQYIYCNGYNDLNPSRQPDPMYRSDSVTTMKTGDGNGLGIGFHPDNPNGNQLSLDEARLESVPRASNWMWSCYMTMASNSSFQTYSIVQGSGYIPVPGTLQFSASAYSIVENGGAVTILVTRTNGSSGPVTVNYSTANGTAVAGTDYTAAGGTLSFDDSETSKTFAVTILDDAVSEPDKTVNLALSSPGGGASLGAFSSAVLTIVDDDRPMMQFSSATFEGSSVNNGAFATITVTRTKVTSGAVSVSYATANGTAIAGTDYTAISGTLNFADGETSKTFTIPIAHKSVYEADKTVNLSLSNPTGGTYGALVGVPGTAVLTIVGPPMPTSYDAWANRARITFSGYDKNETLTNFPALVILGNNLSGFAYNQFASSSGGDLRFTDSTGTNTLRHEIDAWSTSGKSYVWVQVPRFTNNCSIWAFWGNASATTAPGYTTDGSVWDSNFVGVWHMNSTTSPDSTANRLNVTGTYGNTNAVGLIGGAQGFASASSTHMVVPNNSKMVFGGTDNYILSAWAYVPSAPSGWHALAVKSPNIGTCYAIMENSATWVYASEASIWGAGVPVPGSWNYVAIQQSYANWNRTVYANGAQTAVAPGVNNSTVGTGDLWFGGDTIGEYFDGLLDEIRLEKTTRSANWIWACYMTMGSNSLFGTYSEVRQSGGSSGNPPVISSSTTANATVGQAFSYQITASGTPTSYNATGLPFGLSVNTGSGLISGTPTTAGNSSVTISAINGSGTGQATLNITISAAGSAPTGLLGWWKLDETSGTTAADSSGNGNNGTLNGAPVWQPTGGKLAGALNFNYGDYVNCGYAASLSTPSVTVAFWMKPSQMAIMCPVDKLPMTTGAGYAVRLRDTGAIWFRLGAEPGVNYDVYGDQLYTNGVWIHVAATFDSASGAARLYINGVMAAHHPTYALTLSAASTPLLFAKENKTGNEPYVGLLDDVRVYDHALTSTEIATVMAGGTVGGGVQAPRISSCVRSSGNCPGLSWTSDSGVTYAVYKSTNLLAGWIAQPLTNIVGDGNTKMFTDPAPLQRDAFYRITAR
jgi:hypothetical protein